MEIHRTTKEAKAAIRIDTINVTERNRPIIEFRQTTGECGCGETFGLKGVCYNRKGHCIYVSSVHAICKKCG